MADDEVEYSMLMPFVVVESKGGPFDDNAFCAGWECGSIDSSLLLASVTAQRTVACPIVRVLTLPQLDLIAMRHGYEMEIVNRDSDWASVVFTAVEG